MLLTSAYILVLLISAWHDYKTHEVKNRFSIIIIVLALYKSNNAIELMSDAILILPLLLALGWLNCGGGDLKFIFANTLYLGIENCYIALIVAMIFVILYYKVILVMIREVKDKNYSYPMLPFLIPAFLICM